MEQDQKRLIRAVVRQVHPDLFTAHPFERSKNAESLKALNVYADQLSKGLTPDPARLEFYVKQGEGIFSQVLTSLPGTASLSPLFFSFGLITEEEALRDAATVAYATDGNDARNLYEWLSAVAEEAALAADQHDAMKREVRLLRSDLEEQYGFATLDIGGEFVLGGEAQRQQVEALTSLAQGLEVLFSSSFQQQQNQIFSPSGKVEKSDFRNLAVRLYHPEGAPLVTVGYQDADGTYNVRTEPMESHVGETGILHIVGHENPARVAAALDKLDLSRAQLLSKVSSFWVRRSRELANALRVTLAVENVWFDARTEDSARKFVLWVGAVLEKKGKLVDALLGRTYAFSILVHSDLSSPLLDFIESSSVLQVRTDCPPKHLLAYMVSEAGELAHETATLVADTKAEEAAALEAVRDALGAKHVVRVCSSYDQHKVLEAAARLVEAAPSLRAAVDLSGISLAIDDCYDVWESGFISIPFDFSITDLQPKLQALLLAPSETAAVAGRNGAAKAIAVMPRTAPRRHHSSHYMRRLSLSQPRPFMQALRMPFHATAPQHFL
jgi:Domain of unknown function (DUF4460)/Domain of unknown function (DUF4461)